METMPPVIAHPPLPAVADLSPYELDLAPAAGALSRRSRRDADRDRARILETAREVFAVYGLDVTLEDIARFGGLSVRTVRRAFPSRELLVETLFDQALTELAVAAEEAAEHADPLLGFLGFLSESAQVQARNSGLRMLLQGETTGPQAAETARTRLLPGLTRLVERARESGVVPNEMRPTDLPALQFVLGNMTEYAENVEPELWQRYLAILLDGLQMTAADCGPDALLPPGRPALPPS
ncbi:TetR/AcrR family transcriptional regulator [Cryptosporangium aurantiacum]|uniref:Transcriptional regulator, TetR family n=1 Tax=Cryptosporangium aurantiacum TaxID=134849 RepID=A0A1M7RJ29_9ACTN|nr:TetR/AcrR family transcriptional regulator [Cryptosporangium aurantiacum]SHN46206.1 transcriptional regulator, TetR family [Cryptosporangium aurantiacum]